MEVNAPATCPTCGTQFIGGYCHTCGERKLDAKEYSLRNFAGSFLETVFSVDNKLLRSLVALINPGKLTTDYLEGRRVPYLRPLQLFFFVNVVYFFAQPFNGSNTFNNQLDSQYQYQSYSGVLVKPLIDTRLQATGQTLNQYATNYNALSSQLARTLLFLLVPLWAGMLWLVTWGLRRTYAMQFIFSLHTFSFLLLYYLSFFSPLYYQLVIWTAKFGQQDLARWMWGENSLTLMFLVVVGVYTTASLHKLFSISLLSAGLRATVACLFFFEIVRLYRLVLFLATYWLL